MLPAAGVLFTAALLLVLNAPAGLLLGQCLDCCSVLQPWKEQLVPKSEALLLNCVEPVSACVNSFAGQLSPPCVPGLVIGMLAALPDMKGKSAQQLQVRQLSISYKAVVV